MRNLDNSAPMMVSCSFQYNFAFNMGGGISSYSSKPVLFNTLVCGNTPDQIVGDWAGGGNTILDLCLIGDEDEDGVDDSVDNCYLYNPDQTDCNGNEVGDVCDIADGTSSDWNDNGIPDDCECLSDINFDGIVSVNDLLIVIGNWGGSGIGDINSDGIVDVSDLLIVVGNWGPCEPYGACCLPSGGCAEGELYICEFVGGEFQGPGTTCSEISCP